MDVKTSRKMFKGAYLLVVMTVLAEVVVESSGSIFPVEEVSDCLKRGYTAAEKRNCGFNKACEDAKYKDAILPCIRLGYDLIYQDSSYHRDSDFDVYGMAHCAMDRCSEGWNKKPTAHGDQFQILSGLAESFSSCLVAVKDCAKPERKKEEL